MAVHTYNDLKQMQMLPLDIKISMSERRIREWVNEFGESGVYVAFSGGKDSTVLLDLVRNRCGYKDVPAVFVDTGLEYPEIREFVRKFENVIWVKPKMNFKQVIEKYGYPFISKEVSKTIYRARRELKKVGVEDLIEAYRIKKERGEKIYCYSQIAMGEFEHKENGKPTGEYSKMYDRSKYKFLLNAPFNVSNYCCDVMKKEPIKRYAKKEMRVAITGQLADESKLRRDNWLKYGCNAFGAKDPISNPMSFWTEQDILKYIHENQIEICSVYGDVVYEQPDECEGQISIWDLGFLKKSDNRKLKTTGCNRTGCMFCGYGCHLEKNPNRFEQMKITHPKQYDWIMKPVEQGGLGYKDIIDWINEHGDLNIKY